jgi:polyferredoxin
MAGRIVGFLQEYILGLSILTMIPGLFFILMGIMYYGFRNVISQPTSPFHFIYQPFGNGDFNAYFLVAGLIIFGIGIYYLYSYLTKRRFVLDELKTDKRSELLKKRNKLETTVKHLPRKYQQMLSEKEEEFNIK